MARQVSYGKLLRLAHQRAIDGKGGLAASIAKMCLDQQADLTPSELDLTYQILRQLIDRVEVQIRRHIADILAERIDVPRDLLAFLSNDAVHVAYPIIVRSRQLSDQDLLTLIARQGTGHAIAVASRPEVSEVVCRRLVNQGEAEIDRTLMRNETAKLGRDSLEILVERSVEAEDYQELLVKRRDLPTDLARRLYVWVGEALRHHIARNFAIDSEALDESVDAAVWTALDEDAGRSQGSAAGWSKTETADPAARVRRRAARLVRVLHQDGADAFLSEVATETRLPAETVARIFAPDSPQTAAIACKALGLDSERFIDVLQAFHDDAGWAGFTIDGGLDRACAYFDRIEPLGAATVLRQWRRRPPGEKPAAH
ncbi:MAG: DUF2336 domain-containing protein [Marivibrio sp.]|uniref:DUF2336 domain-containing protein n=1 Tax=Marivibrio sp. TaxID=2039719 RepID=UPI0032F092AD